MLSLAKVLFIGVDAGDKFLLQSWAADGTLRTFRSLLNNGMTGNTMSLEGFFEGSTWPSFYTGVTPARHGFHRLTQLRSGTYEFFRCLPGEFIKREPFWNHLSRAGKDVAVLDVPLSGISRRVRGIQMVEWGSHDAAYGFQTWPPKLSREVLSKFGPHPMTDSCDSMGRSRQLTLLRDLLVQGVKKKAMLTGHYLKRGGWDFFAQVFTEGHCIGHQCFHFHDPEHPSYSPEIAALTGDLMRDVYMAIDEAIGAILELVDNDTVVVLLASHRMSHTFGAQFLLSDILTGLKAAERLSSTSEPDLSRGKLELILGSCWLRTPRPVKEMLVPIRDRVREWFDDHKVQSPSSLRGIDLKRSKCFPLDNGLQVGGIRLNLMGREPNGIIKQGEESDVFSNQLIEDLLRIVDCDTGLPIVKSVKKTAELYEGECLNHLPDLLVEWSDEKRLGSVGTGNPNGSRLRLTSDKLGIVEGTNSYCRTGDHRPEGLFIAYGPGIMRGHMERTVSIMDFAPTFMSLLGVNCPDIDGRPIVECLEAVPHLPRSR